MKRLRLAVRRLLSVPIQCAQILHRLVLYRGGGFSTIVERQPFAPATCRGSAEPLAKSAMGSSARVAFIISYTPVASEPRVIRQAAALEAKGWRVVVFGLGDKERCPDFWTVVDLPESHNYFTLVAQVAHFLRGGFSFLGRWSRSLGILGYWCNISFAYRARAILQYGPEMARDVGCDLILPHDYFTLPPAMRLAEKLGVPVVLDAHEYATEQYMHSKKWRSFERPVVKAVHHRWFGALDGITTVSDGIRDLLNEDYEFQRPCITIRSIPPKGTRPFKPTGDVVTVLYHGNIDYIRGLHKAIRSMKDWPVNFRFMIRGFAAADYLESLREIARNEGVADRLVIADPVPFASLIDAASEADIGYFVHKDISFQKRYVLPNKFFEYIQAGLALCVSDLPSMADLAKSYDLGVLIEEYDEESIARAINKFDRAGIDRYKRNAIAAREELCWEREGERLIAYYEEILAGVQPAG